MKIRDDVQRVLAAYPRIYFACHERHRRDPESQRTLSSHRASILDHLDVRDGTSVTELADHLGVTASTMSLTVSRLERDGYLTRTRNPDDGRRVDVTLTPLGARMKAAARVLEPSRISALLSRLSTDERRSALRGLELLARAADEEISSWAGKRPALTPHPADSREGAMP